MLIDEKDDEVTKPGRLSVQGFEADDEQLLGELVKLGTTMNFFVYHKILVQFRTTLVQLLQNREPFVSRGEQERDNKAITDYSGYTPELQEPPQYVLEGEGGEYEEEHEKIATALRKCIVKTRMILRDKLTRKVSEIDGGT